MQIFGGAGLEQDQVAQPLVVFADQLDARHPVVVGDLLALPRLGDRHPSDQPHLLVPQPDQRLRDLAGLVGVAAVGKLLLNLAELTCGQRGAHEIARS